VDLNSVLDGFTAEDIFSASGAKGYTFDDLIVLPGHIDFAVDDVDLSTPVTRKLRLSSPVVSSPMDTVTEEGMATAMALQGGLGVIHCHCSVEDQVAMVRAVKSFTNGFISKPACMRPDQPISDLDVLVESRGISGVPVTADGTIGSRLLGLVEGKDVDFVEDRSASLSSVMQPLEAVTTCVSPCTLAEANRALKAAKANYLCVVEEGGHDDDGDGGGGNLVALTTRKDLIKNRDYPHALSSADPARQGGGGGGSGGGGAAAGRYSLAVGAAIQLPLPTSSTHLTDSLARFVLDDDVNNNNDGDQDRYHEAIPHTPPPAPPVKSGSAGSGASSRAIDAHASSTPPSTPITPPASTAQDPYAEPVSPRQAAAMRCIQQEAARKAVLEYQTRALALAEAGVDVLVVDSRHGDTAAQVECVQWLKANLPTSCEVVGGNVATLAQAKRLLDAGVDGLRVGMGVGSISTSQEVKACGRAQLSAIFQASKLAKRYGVPVIADGGIRNTGCAIKVCTVMDSRAFSWSGCRHFFFPVALASVSSSTIGCLSTRFTSGPKKMPILTFL
jgi:IMP dehydrogenase/GMP reductase